VKTTSLIFAAVALALAAIAYPILAPAPQAQTPQTPPAAALARPPRTYPAPTNLKVLPKDLTGQQVHEIMEKWESELGAKCSSCHTADPKNIGPNGKPRLDFVDDSKDEKIVARIMYTMTGDLNQKYFKYSAHESKEKAPPVTCSTCHRGHMHPEEFVPVKEEHMRASVSTMQPAAPGQK